MMNRNMNEITDEDDIVESLKIKLKVSRDKWHTFVQGQKALCDSLTNRYQAEKATHQSQINNKMQSMLAWKMEKGLNLSENDETAINHQEEENSLKGAIVVLHEKVATKKHELEAVKKEKQEDEEAESSSRNPDEAASMSETKKILEGLSYAVHGYQKLSGLKFEKAEFGNLRFFLDGLDETNKERQCSFVLGVSTASTDDEYVVKECEPPLSEEVIAPLLKDLNANPDNLQQFFRGMRRCWKESFGKRETVDE